MDNALPPIPITFDHVSSFIRGLHESSDDALPDEKVRRIIHQTLDAKVHAEASLMQWISSKYVEYFFFV